MSKLPALTPDDPLRAGTPVAPAQPAVPPTAAAKAPAETPAPRRRRAPRRPAAAPVPPRQPEPEAPQTPSGEDWTGATDVTTFRLPAEVLHALHERSRHLGVAKGMTVAAALLELLQRADDELVELVEQTQQRYDSARRRARRA